MGALAQLAGNGLLWLATSLGWNFLLPAATGARANPAYFPLDISIFIAITFPIAFLPTPAGPWRRKLAWTDIALALLSFAVALYYIVLNDKFLNWSRGFSQPNAWDVAVGF